MENTGEIQIPMDLPKEEHEAREQRGRELARRSREQIKPFGQHWAVPSATDPEGRSAYMVDLARGTCTCPDYATRGVKCKHAHAVEYVIIWQDNGDGTVTETVAVRRTYSQHWPSYNAAQVNEQEDFEKLLAGLCDGIVEPPYLGGRPGHKLRDLVFGAVLKVYGTMSARRSQTDLRRCHERGLVSAVPSYNTILRNFDDPAFTPVLNALIEDAALPMRDVEYQFSPDSTGFGTQQHERWYTEKWPKRKEKRPRSRRHFVKLHAMTGTLTNIITSAIVSKAGDAPMLPPMLEATVRAGFNVQEVSADKGYLSRANVDAISAVGAKAFIPFKDNSKGDGPEMWREMHALFMLKRPVFLAHYHRRSNVESTFAMVKTKFGASVRSKLTVAQVNEVLAKCLCHNLVCLILSFYETGTKPSFWREPSTTLRLVQS